MSFADAEWRRFFKQHVAAEADGIAEKTRRIQEEHVRAFRRDDGTTKNVRLIDKTNIRNNRLQVMNQYEMGANVHGAAPSRPAGACPGSRIVYWNRRNSAKGAP